MIARADDFSRAQLQLLLRTDGGIDPDDLDWSAILLAAEADHALQPLAEWFVRHDETPPPRIAEAFSRLGLRVP